MTTPINYDNAAILPVTSYNFKENSRQEDPGGKKIDTRKKTNRNLKELRYLNTYMGPIVSSTSKKLRQTLSYSARKLDFVKDGLRNTLALPLKKLNAMKEYYQGRTIVPLREGKAEN